MCFEGPLWRALLFLRVFYCSSARLNEFGRPYSVLIAPADLR